MTFSSGFLFLSITGGELLPRLKYIVHFLADINHFPTYIDQFKGVIDYFLRFIDHFP